MIAEGKYSERPPARQQPGHSYEHELEKVRRRSIVHGTVVDWIDGEVIVQINGAAYDGRVSRGELAQLPEDLQTDLEEIGFSHDFFVSWTPEPRPGDEPEDSPSYYELTITDVWRESDWAQAESSLSEGTAFPVQATGWNKGGLLVHFGHQVQEGFIPISHLWNFPSHRDAEERENALQDWAESGRVLQVQALEVSREKRKLVLSNKNAEMVRHRAERQNRLQALQVGAVVTGTVRNIRDFGAFVDIGGIEGLLHISEIDWDLVRHPSDYLDEGQELQVKILQVDHAKGHIKLSRKALQETPWKSVSDRYRVGQVVSVVITRKKDFGAFARLEAGVEGLIHVSEVALSSEIRPMDTIREGEKIEVKIIRMDVARQRIGLSRAQVLQEQQPSYDDDYNYVDYGDYGSYADDDY